MFSKPITVKIVVLGEHFESIKADDEFMLSIYSNVMAKMFSPTLQMDSSAYFQLLW